MDKKDLLVGFRQASVSQSMETFRHVAEIASKSALNGAEKALVAYVARELAPHKALEASAVASCRKLRTAAVEHNVTDALKYIDALLAARPVTEGTGTRGQGVIKSYFDASITAAASAAAAARRK